MSPNYQRGNAIYFFLTTPSMNYTPEPHHSSVSERDQITLRTFPLLCPIDVETLIIALIALLEQHEGDILP